MVNLLPTQLQKRLTMLYFVRLLSAFLLLLSVSFFIGALFLIPAYFLASSDAKVQTAALSLTQEAVDKGENGGAAGTLAFYTERVSILKDYVHQPVVAQIFSTLTGNLPKGVSFNNIIVTPQSNTTGAITTAGVADTRDSLLTLVRALQGVSIFKGVSLPFSSLVSETNISFTLIFTYSLP